MTNLREYKLCEYKLWEYKLHQRKLCQYKLHEYKLCKYKLYKCKQEEVYNMSTLTVVTAMGSMFQSEVILVLREWVLYKLVSLEVDEIEELSRCSRWKMDFGAGNPRLDFQVEKMLVWMEMDILEKLVGVEMMELQTVNLLLCGSVTARFGAVYGKFWVHSCSYGETTFWHDLLECSSQLQDLEM